MGPRLFLLEAAGIGVPPPWIRVPIVLAVALLLARFAAGVPLSQLGLRRWRQWTATEKSYFVQVVVLATAAFSLLFAERLRAVLSDPVSRTAIWAGW